MAFAAEPDGAERVIFITHLSACTTCVPGDPCVPFGYVSKYAVATQRQLRHKTSGCAAPFEAHRGIVHYCRPQRVLTRAAYLSGDKSSRRRPL